MVSSECGGCVIDGSHHGDADRGEHRALAGIRRAVARDRANAVAAAEAEGELRRQAETAMLAEQKVRRESEAMTAMLDSLLASISAGREALASLRQQMDKAAKTLQSDAGDPLVRARLLFTLGLTRQNLGDFQEAVPLMEKSLVIRKEVRPTTL